jgi:hypothetical protein
MITGNPGVGKTFTSKMALMYFVATDYRPIVSSKNSLDDIKKSISLEPSIKQVILMDDFLGQIDLEQGGRKFTNELVSMINYVEKLPNTRLILNTRINILSLMSTKNTKFEERIGEKDIKILRIDEYSSLEKAKVLYNSLYYFNVGKDYIENLCVEKVYLAIINHPNYNPRLIEHMSKPKILQNIDPNKYYKEIIYLLNHPEKIWNDEFENQIGKEDRALMYIIYSLSNYRTYIVYVKEAYEALLAHDMSFDNTIDHFKNSIMHLSDGLIKISSYDRLQANKYVEVLNPSLNDYLRDNIPEVERKKILENAIYIDQFERLVPKFRFSIELEDLIKNKKILSLKNIRSHPFAMVLEYIVYYRKLDLINGEEVLKILSHKYYSNDFKTYEYFDVLNFFLKKDIVDHFDILHQIVQKEFLEAVSENLKYTESVDFIEQINFLSNDMFEGFISGILNDKIKKKYLEELVEKINREDILDYQYFIERNIDADGVNETMIYDEIIAEYEKSVNKKIAMEPIRITTHIEPEDIVEAVKSIDYEINESIDQAIKAIYDEEQSDDIDFDSLIGKDDETNVGIEIDSMFDSLLGKV